MTGDKTFAVTTSCYEQIVRVKAYYEFTHGEQLTFSDCLSKMADFVMVYRVGSGPGGKVA